MPTFDELFTEHVGAALGRQLALSEILGDRSWRLDLATGHARFGMDLSFPAQVIGTESETEGTWLWAWANPHSRLPLTMLRRANALRELGERRGIPFLKTRSFSTDEVTAEQTAIVASGLCGHLPYYRGAYPGGAVFFILEEPPPAIQGPYDARRIASVLLEAISNFPIDHRAMSRAFLESQRFRLSDDEGCWTSQAPDGRMLKITFDPRGRIANVAARVGPQDERVTTP
jgi:hypothetical protein